MHVPSALAIRLNSPQFAILHLENCFERMQCAKHILR